MKLFSSDGKAKYTDYDMNQHDVDKIVRAVVKELAEKHML